MKVAETMIAMAASGIYAYCSCIQHFYHSIKLAAVFVRFLKKKMCSSYQSYVGKEHKSCKSIDD